MMISIMQGRLLPPVGKRIQAFPKDAWREEFLRAAEAGLDGLEWIYEAYGAEVNPLGTDEGIQEMRALAKQHGQVVRSVCADWFMDFPLVRASDSEKKERTEKLAWLIGQCQKAGITRMVIPFVDVSAIRDKQDVEDVVSMVGGMAPLAERCGVELHLETALGPEDFAALLARFSSPWIKANYDSGNSAALGYKVADEFAAYGERVGSVHIKDRVLGGTTVPLGQGAADFDRLFQELKRVRYAGDFVLQVARGEAGQEVDWASANRGYVERMAERNGIRL